MNIIKNVLLWIAVVILFIISCMTNVAGIIFGLIAIALIIPIKKWQELLAKFLKKPIKIIAIILAIILMFASVSSVSEESGDGVSSNAVSFSEQEEDESSNISSTENASINDETSSENENSSSEDTSSKENVSSTNSEPPQSTITSKENASSEETHIHTFVAATCVSAEKCSCGVTNGTALGHKFSNGTCTVCGATDPNYTPPQTNTTTYVLNTKSMKFHRLSCGWLPEENREDTTKSREELINEGYTPCGHCDP